MGSFPRKADIPVSTGADGASTVRWKRRVCYLEQASPSVNGFAIAPVYSNIHLAAAPGDANRAHVLKRLGGSRYNALVRPGGIVRLQTVVGAACVCEKHSMTCSGEQRSSAAGGRAGKRRAPGQRRCGRWRPARSGSLPAARGRPGPRAGDRPPERGRSARSGSFAWERRA